ncbi:hypothetical protein GCM10027275_44720 [Rhabdobacter roseus]|uniref:Uncharacterized protein n=1 Tax=Rhabdobacter roseus TaxID=1655419 RepID=A0A840TRE2_9BACT|nr:hypothetical protein [Rhabdobacter roseus]MBB5286471.1 hypothetical protein [Rhabdobacter roseus]
MKKLWFLCYLSIAFLLITRLSHLTLPDLMVEKNTSAERIKEMEQQLLNKYQLQAKIEVLKRNVANEITNLKFTLFDHNEPKSTCESDNFGLLVLQPNAPGGCRCSIADKGWEDQLLAKIR